MSKERARRHSWRGLCLGRRGQDPSTRFHVPHMFPPTLQSLPLQPYYASLLSEDTSLLPGQGLILIFLSVGSGQQHLTSLCISHGAAHRDWQLLAPIGFVERTQLAFRWPRPSAVLVLG